MTIEKMAYSVDETAEAIGVHANTVRKMIADGRLSAVSLGRKYLIPKPEISRFLTQTPTRLLKIEV
jgi:excisionase family DNA binding protein